MNGDIWDEIPPEFQAIITEEGNRHWEHVASLAAEKWERDGIIGNIIGGMTYDGLPTEIHDAIFQANLDSVLPHWVERAGGPHSEAVRVFNQIIGPHHRRPNLRRRLRRIPGPAKAKGNAECSRAGRHQRNRYR